VVSGIKKGFCVQKPYRKHKKKDEAMTYSTAVAVPSAQRSLTAVFGMGTGVTSSLWSPHPICLGPCAERSGPLKKTWKSQRDGSEPFLIAGPAGPGWGLSKPYKESRKSY
jgi:hypothetical protein